MIIDVNPEQWAAVTKEAQDLYKDRQPKSQVIDVDQSVWDSLKEAGTAAVQYQQPARPTPATDKWQPPKPTPSTAEFIKQFEGFSAQPYYDHKGESVGYGRLFPHGKAPKNVTEEQALEWLKEDIQSATKAVDRYVKVPLTPQQRTALISFTYNLGAGNLKSSTLLKKLNKKNYAGAADELLRWNKAGGEVQKGLVKRREKERRLFLTQPARIDQMPKPRTEPSFTAKPLPAEKSLTVGERLAQIKRRQEEETEARHKIAQEDEPSTRAADLKALAHIRAAARLSVNGVTYERTGDGRWMRTNQ